MEVGSSGPSHGGNIKSFGGVRQFFKSQSEDRWPYLVISIIASLLILPSALGLFMVMLEWAFDIRLNKSELSTILKLFELPSYSIVIAESVKWLSQIASFVAGFGMLVLKQWARRLTIVLATFQFAWIAGIYLSILALRINLYGNEGQILSVKIAILTSLWWMVVVWICLSLPKVKAQFK